jgi:hypothetical protein
VSTSTARGASDFGTRRQRGNDLICHLTEGGVPPVRLRSTMGFCPASNARTATAAFSLALDSGTLDALPSPISLDWPRHVKRRTHLRDPERETTR